MVLGATDSQHTLTVDLSHIPPDHCSTATEDLCEAKALGAGKIDALGMAENAALGSVLFY